MNLARYFDKSQRWIEPLAGGVLLEGFDFGGGHAGGAEEFDGVLQKCAPQTMPLVCWVDGEVGDPTDRGFMIEAGCYVAHDIVVWRQGGRRSPIPLLERGTFAMPIGLLLKRNCQRKDRLFGEWRRHDLKAQRQTSGSETHGKAHRRPAKQISGSGVSTNVSPSLAHW